LSLKNIDYLKYEAILVMPVIPLCTL